MLSKQKSQMRLLMREKRGRETMRHTTSLFYLIFNNPKKCRLEVKWLVQGQAYQKIFYFWGTWWLGQLNE